MAKEKWMINANVFAEHLERMAHRAHPSLRPGLLEAAEFAKDFLTVYAVEVEHGEWEYGKWDQGHWVQGNERCRCSVCHRDFAVDNENIWHGCPHCLAKMDGGK